MYVTSDWECVVLHLLLWCIWDLSEWREVDPMFVLWKDANEKILTSTNIFTHWCTFLGLLQFDIYLYWFRNSFRFIKNSIKWNVLRCYSFAWNCLVLHPHDSPGASTCPTGGAGWCIWHIFYYENVLLQLTWLDLNETSMRKISSRTFRLWYFGRFLAFQLIFMYKSLNYSLF